MEWSEKADSTYAAFTSTFVEKFVQHWEIPIRSSGFTETRNPCAAW